MAKLKYIRTRNDLSLYPITESHWQKIEEFADDAVSKMNVDGKTSSQIFGELYTRIRTYCSYRAELGDEAWKFFVRGKIKHLDGTSIGIRLNSVIRDAYYKKYDDHATSELELCVVLAHSCIEEAKSLNKESDEILSQLDKLTADLTQGDNYV